MFLEVIVTVPASTSVSIPPGKTYYYINISILDGRNIIGWWRHYRMVKIIMEGGISLSYSPTLILTVTNP